MVKGSVNPKDPLSKEHWLDSFGVATSVLGVKGVSSTKPTGGSSYSPSNSTKNNSQIIQEVNKGKLGVHSTDYFRIKEKNDKSRNTLPPKYQEIDLSGYKLGNTAYAEVNIVWESQ